MRPSAISSPRRSPEPTPPLRPAVAALALALLGATGPADPADSQTVGGAWQAQGPGYASNGQTENIGTDDPVVGAVHAVVPHPTDANVLWIGSVNGGLWKTMNAGAAAPHWTKQSDGHESLSIGALALDPTDATHQTLVAGIGGYSSYGDRGERIGLLRTTTGGNTWTPLPSLAGKNISGVAPRGAVIVASVNGLDVFNPADLGVWRSTDTGATFTNIAQGDGTATGLPTGFFFDLVSDPSNPAVLFTAVNLAEVFGGGVDGIYRSTDTGATWAKVSDATIDALITDSVGNIELAVGPTGSVVYAAIVDSGRLSGFFRSADGGGTWTAMDLPTTVEDGVAIGIHPGGQGSTHLSIAADPTDADIVYIGGDRQPYLGEGSGGMDFFPNSIGANDYSGRLFRGNAAAAPGSQWTPLTHVGTASNSSPHADSRDMAFDAAGNLIETDDGGIYKRTQPRSAAGDWFSLIGDLQTTEYHGISYDSNSNIVFGGAQDTGTTEQLVTDLPDFYSTSTADGGDTAVDDHSTPGFSTRFSSFQFLGAFRKRVYDASNAVFSQSFPTRTAVKGSPDMAAQFYTPIAVNEVDGDRIIFGASNAVYESMDQGTTVEVPAGGLDITVNAFRGDPIVYGVPGNADLLLVAEAARVYGRFAAPPAALTQLTSPGSTVYDLTIDPQSPSRLFAADSNQVFVSTDSGSSWNDVTGNLMTTFSPAVTRTLAFIPAVDDALVVGTQRGVYVAFDSDGFAVWNRLGTDLPNAPVYELDYDAADDVLIAGLLGRGAFKLTAPLTTPIPIFADGFESGDVSVWSSSAPIP